MEIICRAEEGKGLNIRGEVVSEMHIVLMKDTIETFCWRLTELLEVIGIKWLKHLDFYRIILLMTFMLVAQTFRANGSRAMPGMLGVTFSGEYDDPMYIVSLVRLIPFLSLSK